MAAIQAYILKADITKYLALERWTSEENVQGYSVTNIVYANYELSPVIGVTKVGWYAHLCSQ